MIISILNGIQTAPNYVDRAIGAKSCRFTNNAKENVDAYSVPKKADHTSVREVAGKQMGVGGDDSWGAPVHEEFRQIGRAHV